MKKTNKKRKVIKGIVIGILAVFGLCFVAVGGTFLYFYSNTELDTNKVTGNNLGVAIYDKYDNVLETSANSDKKLVNIHELPAYVTDAFISVEDKNFYKHNGIEPYRIVKAGMVNLLNKGKVQGASTITQQLIKNTLLSPEKTYTRKAKEIVLAMKLEKELTKDEILQEYLNTIYFGENCYGIENASEFYFGVSAKDLTLEQSATLAGLINAPNIYSPVSAPQKACSRRNLVLSRMLKLDKISQTDYDKAVATELQIKACSTPYINSYTRACIGEACELLNMTEKEFVRGKYKIYSYIDPKIQNKLQDVVANYTDVLAQQIVTDNQNYSIVAYCGSSRLPLINTRRQPASLIKPVGIYLPCIQENILSPATPILDEEISIDGYKPSNYNKQFVGWTNVRTALKKSLNIPSIKALSYLTCEKAFNYAQTMGLPVGDSDKNMSYALGSVSGGVTMREITAPYTMLANKGNFNSLSMIKRIETNDGKVIYNRIIKPKKLFDEESCYLITDILRPDSNSNTTACLKDLGIDIASKTGTASVEHNATDYWNVAYTPNYTVTSWLGVADNDQTFSEKYNSSAKASLMTKKLFTSCTSLTKADRFTTPQNIVSVDVDLHQYNEEHRLVQATDGAESFIEIFKANNLPESKQITVDEPTIEPSTPIKKVKKRWWYI